MELCNINDIRVLLEGSGFRFIRSMGQNFLTAQWVPERISRECGAGEGDCVLEIGPGVGCLTQQLSRTAGKVVSVEVDKKLLPVLDKALAGCGNVEIINGDILKMDLPGLVEEHFDGLRPLVCANLPYNITSPALSRILSSGLFQTVTVMVQKEVAGRMCAEAGSSQYGAFTLFIRYYSNPEILFDVPNTCFEPRPKVESTVVRMEKLASPPVSCDRKMFFRVVRAAFNQRRKTLANSMSSGFPGISKDRIISAIEAAGLDPSVRGETLSMEQFALVTDSIAEAAADDGT